LRAIRRRLTFEFGDTVPESDTPGRACACRPLAGKIAIVTGAGGGLGRECAVALAQAGAQIVLIGRSLSTLRETQSLLRATGAVSTIQRCDVTDDRQVHDVFEALLSCDILVNNAGANSPQEFLEVSTETLDDLLRLNVRAVFKVSQAAARHMVNQRSGVIVNMSSQMGHVGAPRRTLYCMTKHAVEGLTKALAVELAPFGVRVNAVAPTYIDTPLTRPFLADPKFRATVMREIPLGRLGTPEEVAAAVVFLASPSASMITGVSLRVDGGYTAH
jgi:NAD(P)-dependent dehydrogenase (short-subunit alcohol dehydrogenase family)